MSLCRNYGRSDKNKGIEKGHCRKTDWMAGVSGRPAGDENDIFVLQDAWHIGRTDHP